MRIIVCGSRTWLSGSSADDLIGTVMEGVAANFIGSPTTIVHGAAPGADTEAALCAEVAGSEDRPMMSIESHPADWEKHDKAAGPIRNQEMVDAGADLVIAFSDQPITRGTADLITRAKDAGIPVWVMGHG